MLFLLYCMGHSSVVKKLYAAIEDFHYITVTVQPRLSEPLWPAPQSKRSINQKVRIIESLYSMYG